MLKTKSFFLPLSRYGNPSKVLASRLPVRFQSTAAEVDEASESSIEWDNARPFEEIRTDTAFNLIRSFLPGGKFYKKDRTELMTGIKEEYGDLFMWPKMMGKRAMLFTHKPEDFELVLRNEGIWPNRPGLETVAYYRGTYRADYFQGVEGTISTQGEKWGSFRSAVNPVLMQPKNVKLYLNKMAQVNLELVERIKEIRDSNTLEVPDTFEEELNRWALESVSVVALDKQLGLLKENRNNPTAKKLFTNMTEFFTLTAELEFKPSLWRIFPTPTFKRLMNNLDEMLEITTGYVKEAIERLEQNNINGIETLVSEQSVLEKLLKLDKRIATVMAMDMLMAGADTTTTTFTGIMLCLAKNPDKQAKLREEVLRILPHKDTEFTEDSIKNIPYLRACIKESLRMYPLAIGNSRIPQKNVVLNGYRVPKGTMVNMISSSLMRDDKHYPRANEFLPERWLRPSKETENTSECPNALKASSPFVYLPFGFGARSCIGRRIVEMELELGVARLIRNFNVEFNYSTDKAFKSLLINVPNIPLKFKFSDID